MKKNIFIRVFAALGGVTLVLAGLGMLAETFFGVPLTARAGQLLGAHTPVAVLLTLLIAILLCVLGVSCVLVLSAKRAVKRTGFVMQKGENGAIGVSIRSIEGLVQTCIRQHEVVASADISVVERRDGIVILLNIEEAAGVNIPLSVGALQKQIRQYVNACTGVDVQEVRVLVENTDADIAASPYAVQNTAVPAAAPAAELQQETAAAEAAVTFEPAAEAVQLYAEEAAQEIVPAAESIAEESVLPDEIEETPAEAEPVPVVQPVPVVMPVIPELPEEEDDRPLHQRLFGAEDEPVFVPAPPELVIESAAEAAEEPAAGEIPEAAEEAGEAADIDANAVLEVVAAMAEETGLQTDAEEDDMPAEQDPRSEM